MEINKIEELSCEDLSDIDNNAIDLTISSPPYWNAIDYDIHTKGDGYYRTRKYNLGYNEYLEWVLNIFAQIKEKTKPGGFCAVVIGTVLLKGKHYALPYDFTTGMVKKGWLFHQNITWYKVTGGVKRAGSFIQHPYPGYFYPNIMTEEILIFCKQGERIFSGKNIEEKLANEILLNDYFKKEIANNIWHIAPVPPGHLDHPCPFPEEIPYRLILLYSYKGDLIFDPFAGSGQTLKVAYHLDRNYLGYDIEEKYVKYARNRITEPLKIRDEQLLAVVKKIKKNIKLKHSNAM
ncbi:MAG: hypothetical protein DRH57_02665 [Candidatus Cloacimonadota bacterium]|nr:MAG: hypothetical protein DRH57_02665 [Candidatus Cloacimonadota bacterium]